MEALATGFMRIDEECSKAGVRYEFFENPYGFTVRFYRHCGEGWNSEPYVNQHQDQHLGSNLGADSETDGVDWEERKNCYTHHYLRTKLKASDIDLFRRSSEG